MRASPFVVGVVGVVLAGVLASPAYAAARNCNPVPLPTDGPLASGAADINPLWGPDPNIFDVAAPHPYWSIVAARGSQGSTVETQLHDGPPTACNAIDTSSNSNAYRSTWVAFDSNGGRFPTGAYSVRYDGGKYIAQFVAGSRSLATNTPSTDQPIASGWANWIVDVRDVYLYAGTTYTFTVTGGFDGLYLLHSDASTPSTWTGRKSTAWASATLPYDDPNEGPGQIGAELVRTTTLTVHPTSSGWYGAVVSRDSWWGAGVTIRVATS